MEQRQLTEKSAIERAIELARNGPCSSVEEIRLQLRKERYANVTEHLSGLTIRKQLTGLIRDRDDAVRQR